MNGYQISQQWACTRTDLEDDRYISTMFGACATAAYANLLLEWDRVRVRGR